MKIYPLVMSMACVTLAVLLLQFIRENDRLEREIELRPSTITRTVPVSMPGPCQPVEAVPIETLRLVMQDVLACNDPVVIEFAEPNHFVESTNMVAPQLDPERIENGMRRLYERMGRIEQQAAARWHDTFITAKTASRHSHRPVVVIVSVEGCEACEALRDRLRSRTDLPYEFAYLKATDPAEGTTVAQLFDLPADQEYPAIVGFWGNVQYPLNEEFFE